MVALPERCRYLRLRVAAKEFNDSKKYGPNADLFFLLHNMRIDVDPSRTREHRQRNFYTSLRPAGLLVLSVRSDPLCQRALGGPPWPRASGPSGPEAGFASSTRAVPARTGESQPPNCELALTFFL